MIACLSALLLTVGGDLQNGDFEAPRAAGAIPGWVLEFGARNGSSEPSSRVGIDETVMHGGRASLHFSGDNQVRGWQAARQEFEARPGATYTLTAFTKTTNVRVEKVGSSEVQQYSNCYVGLFARANDGRIVGKGYARATTPTSDWEQHTATLVAPESARSIEVYAFLSMSGDLWVDDVTLAVEGGHPLPPPEQLLSEGFEGSTNLPAGWSEELGATNAPEGPRSTVRVDPDVGDAGSPHSLHFHGDSSTTKWFALVREFAANPGDTFNLAASFKTADVRKEGIQFENLHTGLEFVGPDGRTVGSRAVAFGPRGTSDWTRAEVKALAPEGAVRVRVSAFLSMSGDAWLDRIVLTRRGGAAPAYGDWQKLDSKHVVVRFPKDHPMRAGMRAHAERLDAAYESICTRLAVKYDEKITVYLYASKDQGRRFTGRTLAFAEPEGRTVHQTTENTLGHEMTHVIALAVGYAQLPLFGEGLGVWLDGQPDELHHQQAAVLLREGKLPSQDTLLTRFRDDESTSYPAAGSFVGFLIETCGLDAFKRIYVMPDPVAQAPQVLGKSLAELDSLWRTAISTRK